MAMTSEERLIEAVCQERRQTVFEWLVNMGRQQGLREAAQGFLLRLLRKRYGDEVDSLVELHVATASLPQLGIWIDHLVFPSTLEEIFNN